MDEWEQEKHGRDTFGLRRGFKKGGGSWAPGVFLPGKKGRRTGLKNLVTIQKVGRA